MRLSENSLQKSQMSGRIGKTCSRGDTMMNIARFLSRLVLFLTLITIGCTQAPSPQASHTPTVNTSKATALPTQVLTPTSPPLSKVPQNCPVGQAPHIISPALGPVIGGAPVWAVMPTTLHIPSYFTYTPKYGWEWKIVWEVGPSYTHPVTLDGRNLHNNTSLTFQIDEQDVSISPILDPSYPGHPRSVLGKDWVEWGSYMYIPAAGCYYLEATWPGGHWRITFAAGR